MLKYVAGKAIFYKMTGWISQHKWMTFGITAVLIGGGFFVFAGGERDSGIDTIVLAERDVRQTISETGTVRSINDAELAFEIAGRVASVDVAAGYEVEAGDVLVALINDDQLAAVEAAQAKLEDLFGDNRPATQDAVSARVNAAELALDNARSDLERVRDTQNTAVRDAREDLLSNDLRAFFTGSSRDTSSYTYTPPTISGTYTGDETGEYVIEHKSLQIGRIK